MNPAAVSPRTRSALGEQRLPLLVPGRNCAGVAHADRVALVVDGENYFAAFAAAAERAERSIVLLTWDFDSRTPLFLRGADRAPTPVSEFLDRLVRRRRHLRVHILNWDFPMIFGKDREVLPVFGLGWKPHRRVRVRYDDTHPLAGCHHQKIAVFDDRFAFVGGMDLTGRRWDSREHRPDDPRRAFLGRPYPPFHDVMLAVDGDAARAVGGIARRRWPRAVGTPIAPHNADSDPWPPWLDAGLTDVDVGISCTAPAVNGDAGERHVEALYLDMIARARRYIYIENQYFTAAGIAEALAARLAERDGPEIVLVTRLLSHGWLEDLSMRVLRARLVRRLRDGDRYHRFEAYFPHREGLPAGTCIDAHAKLIIVDDRWLRVGSANLSNRSMGVDSECDLTVDAGDDPAKQAAVRALRDDLLAEHLGVAAREVTAAVAARPMRQAIARLGSSARSLRPLADDSDWSEAAQGIASIADPERPISLEQMIEQLAPNNEPQADGKIAAATALITVALVALIVAGPNIASTAAVEEMAVWVASFASLWWTAPALVLAYTPASLLRFPRMPVTLALVVVFGATAGAALALTGMMLAAAAAYALGSKLSRQSVRRLAWRKVNRITLMLRWRPLLAVAAVRLVPLAPFATVGIIAGAVRLRFRHFFAGTVLGVLPGVAVTAIVGAELAAFLHSRAAAVDLLAPVAALVGLLTLTLLVQYWLRRLNRVGSTARRTPQISSSVTASRSSARSPPLGAFAASTGRAANSRTSSGP